MQNSSAMLTARSQAAPFQDSALNGLARCCTLERGMARDACRRSRMRIRTRLSRLTGTAKMAAQTRPSSTGDVIVYLARGCRTAVACASDIDMTVLLGLISSTVSGLLEMMNG